MSSPHRIYVDMDDVLCQTALAFTEVFNRDHDTDVGIEQITTFDLSKCFDLTAEEHQEFMESVHRPEVLSAVQPMAGANQVLKDWESAGHEIQVVTGRPPSTKDVSTAWLFKFEVPHHGLTFVDKYSRVLPAWEGGTVRRLEDIAPGEYSVAIEDSWEVASHLAGVVDLDVLLLDRPWNRRPEDASLGKVQRCRDWGEIAERFSVL